MYHTFQAVATPVTHAEGDGSKPGRSSNSKRITTSNACIECRRRKIRCDGAHPCGQCQWYQHPQACAYAKPTQRIVPSRKLVDRLQTQVDQYQSILSRLLPGKDPDELASLPREELINLVLTLPAPAVSPSTGSEPAVSSVRDFSQNVTTSEGADSLDALEQAPDQDQADHHRTRIQSISDDVNSLSLSVDKQSSYVGVSSISAALKVIFKTAPVARPFIAHNYTETALPSRASSPQPVVWNPDPTYLPPADVGHALIESYFHYIHPLMPMVDEQQFWHTWLYSQRQDSPWLALLNMVLALGSLAGSTSEKEDHIAYYQRARKYLDLETFGSGNLLVLQALGLLSGYYLHWLARPNEANCLMGATLRMATALGLHREYNEGQAHGSSGSMKGREVPAGIRRRTWWSLFCLDAWGSTTTGRPSLGRMGPGISVQIPKMMEHVNNAQYQQQLKNLPLIHNISFCKLATRIQDALAGTTLLKFESLMSLDDELVQWHEDLPIILIPVTEHSRQHSTLESQQDRQKRGASLSRSTNTRSTFDFSQPLDRDTTTCPDFLKTPRAIMHWRYQNLRMLMHRPYLLAASLRRAPYASLTAEEKVAVGRCRILAGQTITDINLICPDELIAGWNAVWLMYQAVMVPLVSLFSHLCSSGSIQNPSPSEHGSGSEASAAMAGDEDADRWRLQIETAMAFFDRMVHYSVAAKKSKDVVERLYEASKYLTQNPNQQIPRQNKRHAMPPPPTPSTGYSHIPTPDVQDADVFSQLNASNPLDSSIFTNHEQQSAIPPSLWGSSPGGEAAMNSFWDDMMWDTFPTLSENPGGAADLDMDQYAWLPLGGEPGDPNASGEAWGYPEFEGSYEQQR